MDNNYTSFEEFYPYYLDEHSNLICRRLHFVGTWLVVLIAVLAVITLNAWWLLAMPVVGYGFAWVGHFFFEHNKPATFRYPVYSLMGDWVMWKDIMAGKVRIR
jgi:hypothetical protein